MIRIVWIAFWRDLTAVRTVFKGCADIQSSISNLQCRNSTIDLFKHRYLHKNAVQKLNQHKCRFLLLRCSHRLNGWCGSGSLHPCKANELRHIGVNANLFLHTPQKLFKNYECSHRLIGRCGSGSLHPCRANELRDIAVNAKLSLHTLGKNIQQLWMQPLAYWTVW